MVILCSCISKNKNAFRVHGWCTIHADTYTCCTKQDPLLLDNHESHCSLDAILNCRENGIIYTFPPHYTHRVQSSDIAVLGPLKGKVAQKQSDWILSNPGSTISIHKLSGLVRKAYDLFFTRANILSSFQKTGIWPFDSTIFDAEFGAPNLDVEDPNIILVMILM